MLLKLRNGCGQFWNITESSIITLDIPGLFGEQEDAPLRTDLKTLRNYTLSTARTNESWEAK